MKYHGWSATITGMVTHHPKDGHPPSKIYVNFCEWSWGKISVLSKFQISKSHSAFRFRPYFLHVSSLFEEVQPAYSNLGHTPLLHWLCRGVLRPPPGQTNLSKRLGLRGLRNLLKISIPWELLNTFNRINKANKFFSTNFSKSVTSTAKQFFMAID